MRPLPLAILVAVVVTGVGACRRQAPPPGAQTDVVEALRAEMAAPRHPADGGGRAWIDWARSTEQGAIRAGGTGSWTIVYEAGPEGIAEGGAVYLQVSPFWDWSTPQTDRPEAAGFSEVSTTAEGVELAAATADRQLLAVGILGRDLHAGERLEIVYGSGPAAASIDRFAERDERFWIAVDGDGDGRRALLADHPRLDILAGAPAALVAHLPGTARPGDTVELAIAVVDAAGNAGVPFAGALELRSDEPGLEHPPQVDLQASDVGTLRVPVRVVNPGVHRLTVDGGGGLSAETNPMVAAPGSRSLLWADVHGHSNLSDGTGTPEDYFRYARDVAALDVVALTDHDHWGMRPIANNPEMWADIRTQVARHHEPGRFVTLLGYEWTNWIHGHRHVLYFGDQGEIFDAVDPAYEHPRQLWEALRGLPALTFAHHSAGGPIPTNWDIPPDPEIEPLTEIVSVHGSSEAADTPSPIYRPLRGNYLRDALGRGYRLGFIGSGDGHDGHPGLTSLGSGGGGLAGIWSGSRTRAGVAAAMRARSVYATNGPRAVLSASLDGVPMGGTVSPRLAADLSVSIAAPAPIRSLELIRDGRVADAGACDRARDCEWTTTVRGLSSGSYLYVRAIQEDGGAAWSSPFFVAD